MAAKQPEILDLDKLIPQKRIVKLAGKEIDVSKIPSEVTLEIVEKIDVLSSGESESFPLVFDMIVKICNATDPDEEITKDWLVKNTSLDQLITLMEFVMEPVRERAEQQGKNVERPSNEK